MQNLLIDFRCAWRGLRSHLAFTAAAVLTLALGIGATTTIFGIVDGIVLRPLPFPSADRLFTICEQYPGATPDWCSVAPPNIEDIARRSRAIAAIGIGRSWPYHLATVEGAEGINGGIATPELFHALGVRPVIGRLFDRSDLIGRESAVVDLSYEMWQTRFGGARDVLGRRIALDGKPVTIVGVLPADFRLPKFGQVVLWRPLHIDPRDEQHRAWRGFVAYGLLRPGVSMAAARQELLGIAEQLRREHFATTPHWGLEMESLQDLVIGGVKPILLVFLGAVVFVLLIACANVANLLLARAGERSRELTLRAAIGAGRGRLIRALLVESFVLALAGALLGVLLAEWGTAAFKALAPPDIPRIGGVRVDAPVLAVALLLSVATTFVFGLAPAVYATRTDLASALREGGRSATGRGASFGGLLVVGQLAVALALLTAAGLLMRSFMARASWDPGFERDHLLTFSIFAPDERYPSHAAVAALLARVEGELRALPGVTAVATASGGPLLGGDGSSSFTYSTRTGRAQSAAAWYDMSPSYFRTLGVPVVAGRPLEESDAIGTPRVALVNQSLAARWWPDESPLGKRLRLGSGQLELEVVGVVRDVAPPTPGAPTSPEVYWSNRQEPRPFTYVLVRTAVAPSAVMTAIRDRLRAVDPSLRPSNVATMRERVIDELRTPRFQMLLLTALGVTALLLAAIGIYGLLAYRVSQRTREIGIRIALGAAQREVLASVLGDGLALALVGCILGIAASALAGRLIRSLAPGVGAFDPVTIGVSCVVLLTIASAACLAPARRAASVDPILSLSAD